MRSGWRGVVVALALLAARLAPAQDAPPLHAAEPDAGPRYRTATGVLTAYDAATRVLTLRGAAGTSSFQVARDARAWLGSGRLPLAELPRYAGDRLTVAWSESAAGPVTHTVRLDAGAPALAARAATPSPEPPRQEEFWLRGKAQTLRLYGARGAPVAIVTSGDGGFVHLGPQVAQSLAARGYFVVGFDAKAYLSSFTSHAGGLSVDDVPRDYAALVDFAARGGPPRTLLVGVSEGAGLSLLAATAPALQERLQGVVALGLPDKSELAWRFRDSIIYLTKGIPDEPTFSAREWVGRVAPVPLAAIHSTHDEFVPLPEIRAILDEAREPKRLFVVEALDHRFSGGREGFERSLDEALGWIRAERPAGS